jgi:transglutaminase-like putative cysteine protease
MGTFAASAWASWVILSGAMPARGDGVLAAPETVSRVYRVEQTATLKEIPDGAKSVRWWISIPDEDRNQDLLDFAVTSSPGKWSIEGEAEHGNRFLYVEVANPGKPSLDVNVAFTVRRRSAFVAVDPARVGSITEQLRPLVAAELRKDAPHMAVTAEIQTLADQACGSETNLALQARKLLDAVADAADHYSKDPTKPKCGVGDAKDCMTNGGGCCTDLHSLFIALARARGIPARLQMGYRVQEKNLGKSVDPGYRCWPEYFLPGYGWVPADIVEGDAKDGLGRDRWFTGLSERRVHLNEGREFQLSPPPAAKGRVNTMIIGYAEIDGTPARVLPEGDKQPQLARTVLCTELPDGASAALNGATKQ